MKKRNKIILVITAFILLLLLILFLYLRCIVAPVIQEVLFTESIKGEWIDVMKFVKAKGRYPNNLNELNAYYNYTSEEEVITYLKPIDEGKDEVILWWKKESISGKRIGIKESGLVVKK